VACCVSTSACASTEPRRDASSDAPMGPHVEPGGGGTPPGRRGSRCHPQEPQQIDRSERSTSRLRRKTAGRLWGLWSLVPRSDDRYGPSWRFGARAGGGSEETPRPQNRATPSRGMGHRVPAVQRGSLSFNADRYRDPAPGQGDRRASGRESSRTQNRRSLSEPRSSTG
jgi:hypothetical protein